MRVNAIVLAAGRGTRMGMSTPKTLLPLGGCPLILHTLGKFSCTQTVRKVILVTPEADLDRYRDAVHAEPEFRKMEVLVQRGGIRRQDSVYLGLLHLDSDCEIAVIHDGARPFVSPGIIDKCVMLAERQGAVIVGVPVQDTIKIVAADRRIVETPRRASLWKAQTPQVFRTGIIMEAYQRAQREGFEGTDDSMLVERLGIDVFVVEGHRSNLKVTVPQDLELAESLLRDLKFS